VLLSVADMHGGDRGDRPPSTLETVLAAFLEPGEPQTSKQCFRATN